MTIRKLSKKSLIAIVTVTVCILASTVWLLGFGIAKRITIVDSGNEIHVATMAKTVGDVLKEDDIVLNEGDLVAPPVDSEISSKGIIIITRSKNVNLIIDGEAQTINTRCDTIAEMLSEAGISLSEADYISPSTDTLLTDEMTVEIIIAKKVSVSVDGQTHVRYTTKPNVKTFLDDVMIYLEQYDEITPYLETSISEGLEIEISRVTVSEETIDESIPRNVVNKKSAEYEKGKTVITQKGADGVAKNTYKIIKRNGNIISKTLVNSVTVTKPIDKIVVVGTKEKAVSSRGGFSYRKVITCTATAYEPGVNGTGRTATGRAAGPGVVAVDPNVIPLNSRLYIEAADGSSWTYGYAVAADTGGAIKGNKIDLCFSTRSECLNFGRRSCKVYILD